MKNNILTPILVIYKVGDGLPMYYMEGYDIMDAIVEGYITVVDGYVFLTDKSKTFLKQLFGNKEGLI